MTKERFQSGWGFLILTIICIVVIIIASYSEDRLPTGQTALVGAVFGVALLCVVLWSQLSTYLEITDSRMLENKGYRDFGKDLIDIRDIKYVYRVPQFPLAWFGGSLMVIYSTDDAGKIRHSALRENNYPEETLKKFLIRIKEIKSSIELDSEYEKILSDKLGFRDASENTVATVEHRLRDKGEQWDTVSGLKKFLGKF